MRLALGATTAAAALLAACVGSSPVRCEQAAVNQALAEQELGALIEQHTHAHDEGIAHSDDLDQRMAGARVELILAEHATRRAC